jgi:L-2-hydroxyglutarate oxidase LhgO
MTQFQQGLDYSPFANGEYTLLIQHFVKTKIVGAACRHPSMSIVLLNDGTLIVGPNFQWNGATDFPDFDYIMRGSCFHDALYELFAAGSLDRNHYKNKADLMLKDIIIEDGCSRVVADMIYEGVSWLSPFAEAMGPTSAAVSSRSIRVPRRV